MDIMHANSDITFNDRVEHFLIRWGYRRGEHRVAPGLYAMGNPGKDSPVFVTANYRLSFDALRSALKGIDSYMLILDTFGINVWCAAGKGTFGTEELVRQIEATGLSEVVSHKKLILPQLGAPGVRAFEVTKRTGFRVEYGPVKADDLTAYLKSGKATPDMKKVRFPLPDRIVLIPVELVGYRPAGGHSRRPGVLRAWLAPCTGARDRRAGRYRALPGTVALPADEGLQLERDCCWA